MVDVQDSDDVPAVVNFVYDAVSPSARGPQTGQFSSEGMPNPSGIVEQSPEHELDDGDGHGFGKAAKGSFGGSSNDKLPGLLRHRVR